MDYGDYQDVCDNGLGYYRIFKVATHKARKAHLCVRCSGWIDPGQKYEQLVWLDGGIFRIDNSHMDRQECVQTQQTPRCQPSPTDI